MLTLNAVGAEIWKMLPEVENEDEIVSRLMQEYEADPKQMKHDVGEFLNKLRELGIL